MSTRRRFAFLSLGLCCGLALLTGAFAQPIPDDDEPKPKEKPALTSGAWNEVIQTFPTTEAPQTAWKVQYGTTSGCGFFIKGAWLKRKMSEPWIQVLGDARLAEAFVPYHAGEPRFWDMAYGFDLCELTKADAGRFGVLLPGSANGRSRTVVKEIRDRGIMFKHAESVRRGEALVLWAALDAANYRYLIEYGFQDDGTITLRCGASGRNYGGSEWVGHMHNGLWRIDVNLGGKDHNSVYLCEHIEPDNGDNQKARTEHTLLEKECAVDWDPQKFTMLQVVNTQKKNIRNQPWSYYLMPLRSGTARHYGKNEKCTLHDFWVTRARPKQMNYADVPKYIAKQESIVDTDVVLWYSAPGHHEPRSEDGEMNGDGFRGTTHVMWAGFSLRPANLFDRTPFFKY
jgi:hypothetical protein